MKTYCKNVNIEDRNFISKAVYTCAYANNRWHRGDFIIMLSRYVPESASKLRKKIARDGIIAAEPGIELIIDEMQQEIHNEKLNLKPIWYKQRYDGSSGKIRQIGVEDMKQQLYDYVAVGALQDIFRRIGEYQCASIRGRGQSYGSRALRKWLLNTKLKYCAKADIRKCYESIDKKMLMDFLRARIKNDKVVWLVNELINTHKQGLSIGSYLSQFLCNLYLSQLYHYVAEDLYRIRKGRNRPNKRVRLIDHQLFFMDDILILGTNKKDIHKAMQLIIQKTNELGLSIKPSWRVFECNSDRHYGSEFIDMMGIRFYHTHATVRRRNIRRIRATYKKVQYLRKCHKPIPLCLIRRITSFMGTLDATNSYKFKRRYHVDSINYLCRRAISDADKICFQTNTAIRSY